MLAVNFDSPKLDVLAELGWVDGGPGVAARDAGPSPRLKADGRREPTRAGPLQRAAAAVEAVIPIDEKLAARDARLVTGGTAIEFHESPPSPYKNVLRR